MEPTHTAPPHSLPRPLFVYTLLYGGMTVLAGVLGFKQIALPLGFTTLAVEAGIFAFLMLVAISSAMAQLYGRAVANKLVLWGFAPLGLSILLIWIVLSLPPSPAMSAENLNAFETVLGQVDRIMIAGPIAYGVSLLLNVWLFERLRGSGNGDGAWMMLRGGFASAISQAVDTVIFITVAFYGQFDIVPLLIGQALAVTGRVSAPFYILYAARVMELDGNTIGILSLAYLGADTASNILWGQLGDRFGYRLTFLLTIVAWIGSILLLVVAQTDSLVVLSFVGLGAANSGYMMSAQTMVLELGDRVIGEIGLF